MSSDRFIGGGSGDEDDVDVEAIIDGEEDIFDGNVFDEDVIALDDLDLLYDEEDVCVEDYDDNNLDNYCQNPDICDNCMDCDMQEDCDAFF